MSNTTWENSYTNLYQLQIHQAFYRYQLNSECIWKLVCKANKAKATSMWALCLCAYFEFWMISWKWKIMAMSMLLSNRRSEFPEERLIWFLKFGPVSILSLSGYVCAESITMYLVYFTRACIAKTLELYYGIILLGVCFSFFHTARMHARINFKSTHNVILHDCTPY